MLRVYQVIKRDGKIAEFDVMKISAAISKAFIDSLAKEIHPAVLEILDIRAGEDGTLTRADEIKVKKYIRKKIWFIRLIWKQKAVQISRQLRLLWINRNKGANRGNTSAVSDMMLLSMPVPPTVETVISSLWQRGVIVGAAA